MPLSLLSGLLAFGPDPAAAQPAQAAQAARWAADHVLGTSLDVAVAGAGPDAAAAVGQAVLAQIARLEPKLSRWRPDGELARLNAAGAGVLSPELFETVSRAEDWRARTGGAFDARRRPAPLALVPAARRAVLGPAQALDLDAIAKGYVIDRAMDAARRAAPQASGLLIDLGGDLKVWTAPERGTPWRLAVADPSALQDNAAPLQTLDLDRGALAVSGPGLRFSADGASHVRDPRTGRPAAGRLAAVTAPSAMDADALATAFLVMAPDEALALADATPGVGALLVDAAGATHASAGWTGRAAAAACQAAAWPQGFVVTAAIQVPRHAAANYERPYVAVWITDSARNHVRTLLLLGPEARWRESNYIYWRRIERTDLAAAARIARPTRAPGRYEVVWDGRTDAGGRAPRGQYVLNIEASREHGGHSFVTIPLDIGAAPFERTAEAMQELGATAVRYGKAD